MKRLLSIILAACILIGLAGCSQKIDVASVIGTDKMEMEYYTASFVINENNINEITTYSSYVFVAKVDSYEKTTYINNSTDSPVTYYKVSVIDNIKGNLITEEPITLTKSGGYNKDTGRFMMCQGDVLPAVGKTYIFCATLLNDELYCFCPNEVVEVNDNYKESEDYKKYKESCSVIVEDIPDTSDYISKYDMRKQK